MIHFKLLDVGDRVLRYPQGSLQRKGPVQCQEGQLVLVYVWDKLQVRALTDLKHSRTLNKLRAYTAYIAGILINVVGFAGASELTPRSRCTDTKLVFSSWADSPSRSYPDIRSIVLYGLWGFCTRLLGFESCFSSGRCCRQVRGNRRV